MIIYKATSPSGKIYIGKTIQTLHKRMVGHKYNASHNKEGAFCNAINKYGFEHIKWEVIDTTDSLKKLNELEKYWITKYNSIKEGYNISFGSEMKYIPKGYNTKVKGRKYNEDYILPSMDGRGTKWIGVYDLNGKFLGIFRKRKQATEFTKVENSSIQDCLNREYKQVKGFIFRRIDKKDGGFDIKVNTEDFDYYQMNWFMVYRNGKHLFDRKNQKECAKELGIHKSTISQMLRGKIKSNEKGYSFKFKDKEAA